MARPLRVEFPGALYLVTARALPRQKLSRDPEEAQDFAARLPSLVDAFGAVFHGFCLLPDHYHLLAETPNGNLSRVLHRLNAGYTATVNARRRRRGPLLRSRYRAILLDEDPWLVRLSVHIHLNPVRKRLACTPWEYPASSAAAFLPGGKAIPGISTGKVLDLAGGAPAYVRLVEESFARPTPFPWKTVWRQVALGGEGLRERALAAIEGKDRREFAGFAQPRGGIPLERVIRLVADHTGVPAEEVVRGKFQRVLARKTALYLARQFTGLTLREIGKAFGVDYTTVHMACRRVLELRLQDPAIEELVAALESELRGESTDPPHAVAPGGRGNGAKRRRSRKREKEPGKSGQMELF